MQRSIVKPVVGNGELQLTTREQAAVDTLVNALHDALRRRLPLSLSLVHFDLRLELAHAEQAVALELTDSARGRGRERRERR